MFQIFKGEMNTTFALAEVIKGQPIRVASGGNFWLHIGPDKVTVLSAGRSGLLGVKLDFKASMQEADLKENDWLVCFTDGVIEGNRPIKRFSRKVV